MTHHIVVGALALVAGFVALPAHAAFTRQPWIQDATTSSVTIYWEGGSSSGTQRLEYGAGNFDQSVNGTNVQFNLFKATVSGLSPSSSFQYRVVSNTDTSPAGSFVTAPAAAEPFRFAAYGDTRSNTAPHAAVIAEVIEHAPDFAIIPGDLVNYSDYTGFFAIEKDLLRNTPLFPAPGNHDLGAFYDFGFDRPRWYSFRWSNALFLSISSEESYSAGSDQLEWVESQLQTAAADESILWIVAYHHHPVYSSAEHGNTANMQSTLNALYKQYGVDLVISSHDHVYERIVKDGIAYFVTGGGGADLYDFGTPVEGSEVRVRENHAMIVDVDNGYLELNVFSADGSVIDTWSIEKTPATTPTPTPGETPTPEPTPTGDPGNPSDPTQPGGGCAVAGSGRAPLSLAPLAAFALLLLVRRRRS